MKSGIYLITNMVNGKQYVGKDSGLPRRWSGHRCLLAKGTHRNGHLQAAWNAYGADAFVYTILEYCLPDDLIERESWWISHLDLKNRNKGYNINDPEKGRTGIKHTEETRRKIAAAKTGTKQSPETRLKRAALMAGNKYSLGFKPTEETKAKLSRALQGNQRSLGYRHTEEAKAKIGAASKGNQVGLGRRHSPETRAKMSASHQGRTMPPPSDEWRRNQSESQKGKPWSAARRAAQEKRKEDDHSGDN